MSTPIIEVIIPTINLVSCHRLIREIEKNTLLPKRIIVINNSKYDFDFHSSLFPIDIYKSQIGGVNESLCLGISKITPECDYVSLLNDDIFIGDWFFKRVYKVFETVGGMCSGVCPATIVKLSPKHEYVADINRLVENKFSLKRMIKREGWALTLKRNDLDKVPPMPYDRIKLFHGDDWFWIYTTFELNKRWWKDIGNSIYHVGGATARPMGFRIYKKPEWNEFREILIELQNTLSAESLSYCQKRYRLWQG